MYKPETLPKEITSVDALAEFMHRQLTLIADSLTMIEQGRFLPILSTAPLKPRNGMLAIADGVNWNPTGAGTVGLYEYRSGSWVKL